MANYTVKLSSAPKGHAIPQLLRDAGAFIGKQKHGALGWFDAFSAEPIPKEWNEEKATRLRASGFAFLHLPEGSVLALVSSNAKSPAAVALLGSEGEARTVANSLEEFLSLWSKGKTDIDELDDEEGAAGRKALGAWLKENKIKAPKVKADFDFEAWLDGDSAPLPAPAKAAKVAPREVTPTMKELGPKLRQLASIMGMRADAPEVVEYVTKVLGKKVPQSTSDQNDEANVSAPKAGIELVVSHKIVNDAYPPITKTGKTFIPYVCHAWINEKFPEPVLGVPMKATEDEVKKKLGKPDGVRKRFTTDKKPTIAYWRRDLGGGVELDLSFDECFEAEMTVRSARPLEA